MSKFKQLVIDEEPFEPRSFKNPFGSITTFTILYKSKIVSTQVCSEELLMDRALCFSTVKSLLKELQVNE